MAQRKSVEKRDRSVFHDEFENPSVGPIGLHRGKRSVAARTMPYIIVLLVAVLCALVAWGFLSGNIQAFFGGQSKPVVTASQVRNAVRNRAKKKPADRASRNKSAASASSDKSSLQSSSKKDSASKRESDSSKAQPNHDSQVVIFNALPATETTRNGFAGRKAAVLTSAGYANVRATTLASGQPQTNTVWYRSAADEATARDVASKLGIAAVQMQSGLQEPVAAVFVTAQ